LSYFRRAVVQTPFVRDLGDTVILGGWVNLSGTEKRQILPAGAALRRHLAQEPKGLAAHLHPGDARTQVTLADHP
jgi:hypothetical protein